MSKESSGAVLQNPAYPYLSGTGMSVAALGKYGGE